MLVTERLKKVLIDDDRAGRNDRVHHVVLDQVDHDLLQSCGDKRAGETEDNCAIFFLQHLVVNLRGTPEVARGKRHLAHRLDQRDDVVLLDVDVLDDFNQEIGFLRFHSYVPGYNHFM